MNASSIDLFHAIHLPAMEAAAQDVLRSGLIANGPKVDEFERAFSTIAERDYIVSTNDLTSAVMLALHLAGVRVGDEVATLAFSCLQSNSPITRLGARPVWIDVDITNMSMSLEDLAAKLTTSVKAVIVYHIAGYPANVEHIAALCRDRRIPLIEDCNNAIGALLNGHPVGTVGDYAVYSLYPNRQINGIDGGMLATPDAKTALRATQLRRFGINAQSFRDKRGEINQESDVAEIGWSAALNNLNAAVALAQMTSLEERTTRTQVVAARLREGLMGFKRLRPVQPVAGGVPAYWGFLVQSEQRDALLDHLKARGVKSSLLHQRNDWYSGFGTPREHLPNTARVMREMLALPCGWWLSNEQLADLLITINEFEAG